MSRMNDLDLLLKEVTEHSRAAMEAAEEIRKLFSGSEAAEEKKETPAEEKKEGPSFTELRAFLAEKSRAGFTAEIRQILADHGANKLSAVKPEEYAAVMKEAEVLK